MIISVTFSKPTKDVEAILGKPFEKIKITADFFFSDNPTFSVSIDEQGEAIMITP